MMVSILTQPVGWVQHLLDQADLLDTDCFNPHPACWLGATFKSVTLLSGVYGFNPHPACWLGATRLDVILLACLTVSILTQPVGWVQRVLPAAHLPGSHVSILTQPVGWVQRPPDVVYSTLYGVSILTQPVGWVQQIKKETP